MYSKASKRERRRSVMEYAGAGVGGQRESSYQAIGRSGPTRDKYHSSFLFAQPLPAGVNSVIKLARARKARTQKMLMSALLPFCSRSRLQKPCLQRSLDAISFERKPLRGSLKHQAQILKLPRNGFFRRNGVQAIRKRGLYSRGREERRAIKQSLSNEVTAWKSEHLRTSMLEPSCSGIHSTKLPFQRILDIALSVFKLLRR